MPKPPEALPGSFVDEELGQHHTDLLFKVRLMTGGDALIHLVVKHKSAPATRWPVSVGDDVVRAALRRLVPAREEEIMASFGQQYFEEGKATGMALGKAEGEASTLIWLAEKRFGPLPADLRARVLAADAAAIEAWLDRLMEAPSLEVLFSATN